MMRALKKKPIWLLDTDLGDMIPFPGYEECASFLGISISALSHRIRRNALNIKQYRIITDKEALSDGCKG